MWKVLMVALLAVLADLPPADAAFDPNRTVTAVDPAAKTFSCRANARAPSYTYRTTDKTVYRISGGRPRLYYLWNKGSFSEIKVGEIVTVQYHLGGNERIAERVSIYPKKSAARRQ